MIRRRIYNLLRGEILLWLLFIFAAGANIEVVGLVDAFLQHRRGGVSDGTIRVLDLIGIGLLGATLIGLRVRSRKNVGVVSVLVCASIPGLLLVLSELVF